MGISSDLARPTEGVFTLWRTPEADRCLEGAEWDLFREGLSDLVKKLDSAGRAGRTGLRLFDRLQTGQKIALLLDVATALTSREVQPPELTAINEVAIGAVLETIKAGLASECRSRPKKGKVAPQRLRSCVLAAHTAEIIKPGESWGGDPEPWSPPQPDDNDYDIWESLLEDLADRLLWDADYEMEGAFIDSPPEESEFLHALSRISDGYFVAVAPDPRDTDLPRLRSELRQLCGHQV